jgi:hypothetical protein
LFVSPLALACGPAEKRPRQRERGELDDGERKGKARLIACIVLLIRERERERDAEVGGGVGERREAPRAKLIPPRGAKLGVFALSAC